MAAIIKNILKIILIAFTIFESSLITRKIGGHNLNIEEFKNIKIAYVRRVGAYGSENQKLMEDFKTYLKEKNLLSDEATLLGIALDDPAATPAEKQRYDIGLIIEEYQAVELETRKIDDGKYAIFEVPHTKDDAIAFWNNIAQLTSGLSVDREKPVIERYSMKKIALHLCEFCVPLS